MGHTTRRLWTLALAAAGAASVGVLVLLFTAPSRQAAFVYASGSEAAARYAAADAAANREIVAPPRTVRTPMRTAYLPALVTPAAVRQAEARWQVRLTGHPRLVIGDDMCVLWPGDHDAVALWGQPTDVIYSEAEPALRTGANNEVVIWLGTAHLNQQRPVPELRAKLDALVDEVGERPYVVVGPLAPQGAAGELLRQYDDFNRYLARRYPYYVNPAEILGIPGDGDRFYSDGRHLRPAAYRALDAAVETLLQIARADRVEERAPESLLLSAWAFLPEMRGADTPEPNLWKVAVSGHKRIVIGDSMCYLWPGEDHDTIGLWGRTSDVIRANAEHVLQSYAHDEVVLWVGTAHLIEGGNLGRLQRDIAALVRACGDRPYVVVGPLCPRKYKTNREKKDLYAAINEHLAQTYRYYVDPAEVLDADHDGRWLFKDDHIHLKPEAYAQLEPAVNEVLAQARADLAAPALLASAR